jgi:hypothetical protein
MKKYSISYDLLKPGQNYDSLITRLIALGAVKVEYSQWILKTTTMNAVSIRDDLKRFMDANDRLLVAGLTGETAWINLLVTDGSFKQAIAA